MARPRVIPCLLLRNQGLVKTVRFKNPTYIGDPTNAVRIFNDKEVDELAFLDITAARDKREPQFELLARMASECFMPLSYGGGVRTIQTMRKLFALGIEKIAVNTAAVERPGFVREAADFFGSSSVVVSIDARKRRLGGYEVVTLGGQRKTGLDPARFAATMEREGAGEVLLNSVDRDGTMTGYDLDLTRMVSSAVGIPVIACGGAGSLEDLGKVISEGGASAAAAGSLFVFHGPHRAVLITYPSQTQLNTALDPMVDRSS
ncbi:MAG: AglZ/HisF2 family acetamidino modification protein [Gemmatimonadaceae bacterium]